MIRKEGRGVSKVYLGEKEKKGEKEGKEKGKEDDYKKEAEGRKKEGKED